MSAVATALTTAAITIVVLMIATWLRQPGR